MDEATSIKYGSFSPEVAEFDEITLHDAVEAAGCGKFQIRMMCIIGIVAMAEALELMLLSILSPTLKCEWHLSDFQIALITTAVFGGMTIGAPAFGIFSDKMGRKIGLSSAVVFTLIFGLLSAISPSYVWLLIFRGLAGIGLGSITLCGATYCEYLPVKWRAKMILILLFSWGFGSVIESLLGFLVIDSIGWRWFVALTAFPFVPFLILVPKYFPESARYHLVSGNPDKARFVLAEIARENGNVLPEGRIRAETHQNRGRIGDLFSAEFRLATFLLCILWILIVLCYYGIALFSTVLFTKEGVLLDSHTHNNLSNLTCAGLSSEGYISLMITSSAELPGNLLTLLLVDAIGRKKTIALEAIIFSISISSLFIISHGPFMLAAVFIGRAMGLGSFDALYIFTPEIYPTQFRAVGTGACSGFGRIGAMIAPLVAQVASSSSIYFPIGIFSALSVVSAIVALLIPFETKGADRG